MLPHARHLGDAVDKDLGEKIDFVSCVLKTFSVTWGNPSLEFGPTSFGSQSPLIYFVLIKLSIGEVMFT